MAHRRNQDERDLVSVELFTGAGGLAMGTALAGFAHRSVIEWNPDACNTLRANSARVRFMADWQIQEADVRDIGFRELRDESICSLRVLRANHSHWVASTRRTTTAATCSQRFFARHARFTRKR